MEQTLPNTCKVSFNDPHRLHEFNLIIVPDEGYWCGGRFYFQIFIPEEYNMIVRNSSLNSFQLHKFKNCYDNLI